MVRDRAGDLDISIYCAVNGQAGREAIFYGLLCEAHGHGVQVINWMDETSAINTCPGAVRLTISAMSLPFQSFYRLLQTDVPG